MSDIALTIAILTKNSEKTIGYTLASLAQQKLDNWLFEIIVVDGMSTDRTLDIIEQWVPRLKRKFGENLSRFLIVQEKINTIGFARNVALKFAKGAWILWLDSDNIMSPNYISEALSKGLTSEENVAVFYPNHVKPIAKNLISKVILRYLSHASMYKAISHYYILKLPIHKLRYTAMQGTLCNVKALRNVGGFNPILPAAEDVDLFLRLMNRGYTAESFNGTLYFFIRRNLRSWFKQAVYWGYGQYLLSHLGREGTWDTGYRAKFMVTKMFREILATYRMVKDPLDLLIPLCYLYRRMGYYLGWNYARKYVRNVNKRHEKNVKQ